MATDAPAKKAAAKKAAPKAAPKARKTVAEGASPRGHLAADVLAICEKYAAGKVKIEGDKPLTPHRMAVLVAERTGGDAPSTGAVAAVFKRWQEFGFAQFSEKPFAFKKLSAKGEKLGLEGVIQARRDDRKKVTAAAKKAAAK